MYVYALLHPQPLSLHGDVGTYGTGDSEGVEPLLIGISGVGLNVEHGPYAPRVSVDGNNLHGCPVYFCGASIYGRFCGCASTACLNLNEVRLFGYYVTL